MVKLETTFLHSKLARRIFWLFILCALVPITVLALVSLRNVTTELNDENRRVLHQAGREEAMNIFEKLNFVEADLKLIAYALRGQSARSLASPGNSSRELSPNLAGRLEGLELVTPDGNHRILFGEVQLHLDFTKEQQGFLHSGKSILTTLPCIVGEQCIFLSRELAAGHLDDGILVAEINSSYLWDAENLVPNTNICVLDSTGATLFCSAESPDSFPAQITHSFSGEFEWKSNGRDYLANYWNLPLEGSFFVSHWTIISSRAKPDILAPLTRFRTSFILVYLLALWIVLLLSLVQIRRHLVPLGKLKDGTSQLSLGNFHTRVMVTSGDEFQDLAASFNFMADRIEKQLNSLKVLNEIDRAILSAWDIEKILSTLSSRLGQLFALDLVSVNLFDSNGSLSTTTYIYGPALNRRKIQQSLAFTINEVREIGPEPRVFTLAEKTNPPNYLKPLVSRGMTCFLVVPIFVEESLSAVLTLGHATACHWTEEDKESASKLADQLAVALANSRLIGQLQQLQWGSLTALARAIDAKSPWTMGHSERVTRNAVRIAEKMGLPPKELDIIRRGGLLHDIGKIGTPVSILDKPARLTDEEMKIMREHVAIGARILDPIPGLAESMPIVLQHHEWVNGSGYPNGLAGDEISLHARIFAVADCFDALVSERPYRAGMPLERAMQIIQEGVGKQFDPNVFKVFQEIVASGRISDETNETERTAVETV